MRILLVRPGQPQSTRGLRHITVCEPLELEYLAAGVPEHEVRVVDLLMGDELEASMRSFLPQILGTTCYINNVPEAVAVCRDAKRVDPTVTTVVGGVHAMGNPDDFAGTPVDVVVHGEGVAVFRELVAAIESSSPLAAIAGIAINTRDGFKDSGPRPLRPDVSCIPLPNREVVSKHLDHYHYHDIKPLAIMKTSWGCPCACTFCYNREVVGRKFYARPAASVVEEIESIRAPYVFIIDDVFFWDRQRALDLYELIRARRIEKEYAVYCRADFIAHNEDILAKWKDIGLRILRVGMEAIHDWELQDYDKRITSDCNREAIEVCRRLGIALSASFLLRPDYGKDDFRRLREFIVETGLTHVFLNPLTPLPGTALHEQLKEDIVEDHRGSAPLWDFQHCVLKPTKLSLRDFYRQMAITYLTAVNPFRPNKLALRKRPPLRALLTLAKVLWEVNMSHKDHQKVAAAGRGVYRFDDGRHETRAAS